MRVAFGPPKLLQHRSSPCRVLAHARRNSSCRAPRAVSGESGQQLLDTTQEEDVSEVPLKRGLGPGEWQQTLWKSFAVAGIGMHTGETACIKVKPAHAGEGRYFVRVPQGTNTPQLEYEQDDQPEHELFPDFYSQETEVDDERGEDERVELFLEYMKAQRRDKFSGTFYEYGVLMNKVDVVERAPIQEEVQPRTRDDDYVVASIDNVSVRDHAQCTDLVSESCTVQSVEHLLSALEACGIDNARIEIEGGPEVPVADGSAFLWTDMIRRSGLTPAMTVHEGKPARVRRAALRFDEPFTLSENGRSITFIPNDNMKISYGLDYPMAAIGKQWHSWCQQHSADVYMRTVAGARSFVPSVQELYALRDMGLVRAGAEGVLLVANGNGWVQEDLKQFDNEPARHKVLDLIGDLSLLSLGGMSGLPFGHIIAHNADHKMHIKFIKLMKEMAGEDFYDGYIPNPDLPN